MTRTVSGRTLTAVTGRALFEVIHKRPAPEVINGWSRLTKVLDYLTGMLPTWAHIHSTEDLNTTNALIPIVAYLCQNGGTFPTQDSVKHAVNWLYAALMWSRYTSQTDQRLEGDVALVAKEMQPWDTLRAQIIDQRGRIKVEPSDFAGRGVQSPFYRATYVLAKAHNAVDWFNGLPLSKRHGKSFGIHSHHIFPQAILYKNGFNNSDYTDRQLVNEIANRAFLTADSNIANADAPPDAYLPEVDTKYPGALSSQFVPMDPNLWKVERYRDFLVARRETIAMKLNEFMAALIEKPEIPHLRPVTELIKLGESYTLEFKSTLQWDIVQGKINKALRTSCLKTIAAFLNSEGGTLVIGVEDDRSIYGLDADLKTLGDRDKFERLLVSMVSDGIGPSVSPYYKIRFEVVDGKDVCILDVDRAAEHVFAKTEKGKEFFIRAGNTTKSLDPEEAHQYIEQHLV